MVLVVVVLVILRQGYTPAYPAGMGFKNLCWLDKNGSIPQNTTNLHSSHRNNLPSSVVANDKVGITITLNGDPSEDGTGGQLLTFKHWREGTGTTDLIQKIFTNTLF